jgi:acyl-coenzyme A thioesterase PaaI-like protein
MSDSLPSGQDFRSPWDMGDPPVASPEFLRLIGEMRGLLDRLSISHPDAALSADLANKVSELSAGLEPALGTEKDRICGRLLDQPGRAYLMFPPFEIHHLDRRELRGTVTYGTHFLGRNGAVHGGTISLLFDDVLGRVVNCYGRLRSRTAYLHIDYRAVTPVGAPLSFRAWIDREEGRKRFVRGALYNGETLCVEAEGLFIELKPEQQ